MAQNLAFAGTAAADGRAEAADPNDKFGAAGKENAATSDWINRRLFMFEI